MTPEHRQEARDLIYLAVMDIKVAERTVTAEEPLIGPTLFHAQQAVEKLLKAFLVIKGKEFSRTHDLVALLGLCAEIDDEFATLRSTASTLNPYAVAPRYLRRLESQTIESAYRALALARDVHDFVMERLLTHLME